MSEILAYVQYYFQPLSGLLIGSVIVLFVCYINWYGDIKANTVRWIAKKIFGDGFRSAESADHLFMTITSLLLAGGGILIILALLYLNA